MTDDSMMSEINNGHSLYNILNKHGAKAMPVLKDANADFVGLTGGEIYSIVCFREAGDNGYELLLSLKDAGAKLNTMTRNTLYSVISVMDGEYGKGREVIKLLNEEKADFSTLDDSEVYSIASIKENSAYTQLENLEFLKGMGFNFGLLSNTNIGSLVYGGKDQAGKVEVFQWFKNNDALKDREIFDSSKLEKIKALCQPILEENAEKIKEAYTSVEELFEKYNVFETAKNLNITSLDDGWDSILVNVPREELFESSSGSMADINIDGNRVDIIRYDDDMIFFVSKGKLLQFERVIDCNDFENGLYELFNKHGINLVTKTDAELELKYIRLDFNDKYLGYHNCTAYGQMIGLNNTIISQYCPNEEQANVVGDVHPEL
jgi:hypothetical protein